MYKLFSFLVLATVAFVLWPETDRKIVPEPSRFPMCSDVPKNFGTEDIPADAPASPEGVEPIYGVIASCEEARCEWRESCRGACGKGCGANGERMPNCREAEEVTRDYFSQARGITLTCTYRMIDCASHAKCRVHDTCLERCIVSHPCPLDRGPVFELCRTRCHLRALHPCARSWMEGAPGRASCQTEALRFARLVACKPKP